MPSAQQLWQGQESAVFAVLQQCFEVFVLKKLRNRQQEALQWFFDLSASCSLPELQESKPWHAQFMSGIPVLCALHVTGIIPTLDEIFACPLSVIETRSNVMLLFSALLRADVPLYWTAEEYLSSQDSAFLLFQLVVIYEHLRECPLTIPKGAFRDAERIAQRIHQHELSEAKYQTQLVQAELNERNRQQARLEQLEQQRRVEDLITARSRRWQSDLHALKRLSSLVDSVDEPSRLVARRWVNVKTTRTVDSSLLAVRCDLHREDLRSHCWQV
eukprot:TRINITY_DN960_c0_g1_i2.p1 TRINITY_DN960_c0_g1~~TRINITY_DN960_c0_g1_i2.p1  ORF type:complete len:273 (-),score=34.19 TRINITY_DN960_c0_g1_i2:336-1154(-)